MPMRICEINDIASVASDLTRELEARGHEVTLIRPRLVGGSLPWMIKPVVSPVRAYEWAQMIRQVHAGNFDLVHIHYAYLGMVGVLGKFPYILHCHGSDMREMAPYSKPMINRALAGAAHVYYATPDLAPYVLSRRPDAEFLPNPVDTEMFRPLRPARESRDVFICCALTDIKGASRILAACKRLAKERPESRITAIAGGEHTQAFRELPNVRLIPHQSRRNLPDIISKHGVVIGQVLLGVVGMAELEAMACGRPVIAWFNRDDVYEERPPFVRAVDGYDIAHAVMRLVDDADARQETGDAGRAWVSANHGLGRIAERVEQTALQLLAAR
jgi:glycosyltransferase involved in cell wall biosynthesis